METREEEKGVRKNRHLADRFLARICYIKFSELFWLCQNGQIMAFLLSLAKK
jgi:hypothetical protein